MGENNLHTNKNGKEISLYGSLEGKVFLAVTWYDAFMVSEEYKLRPKEKEFVVLVIAAYSLGIKDYLSDRFKEYLAPNFTTAVSDYMTKMKKKEWLQVTKVKKKVRIPAFFEELNFEEELSLNLRVCTPPPQTENTNS